MGKKKGRVQKTNFISRTLSNLKMNVNIYEEDKQSRKLDTPQECTRWMGMLRERA